MNRKAGKEFHAKIMLFGEYGVICNSMGLTVPYQEFKGRLNFKENVAATLHDFAEKSNKSIQNFYSFLKKLHDKKQLKFKLRSDLFKKEIDEGLFFESNIPQGFGIGSSGALVAALYDRYAEDRINNRKNLNPLKIKKLKEILGQMESYFHGKSSGLDPLNCYMKQPLLIQANDEIDKVGVDLEERQKQKGMFLIDTGTIGDTEPLVNYFMEQCQNDTFFKGLQTEMIPSSDRCIKSFIKGEVREFYKNIKELSKYLLVNFAPMIPEPFKDVWKKGLETSVYYLKLCGSGGGGYLLGFAEDLDYAKKMLEELDVKIIPLYQLAKQNDTEIKK
jgi:mevalonate kinase